MKQTVTREQAEQSAFFQSVPAKVWWRKWVADVPETKGAALAC